MQNDILVPACCGT